MIRTTISIDELLLERAKELTGYKRTTDVINLALKDTIAKRSLARLAALGGTTKSIEMPPRRKVK